MFVALLVASGPGAAAGCTRPAPVTPVACGAAWAKLDAFALPDVDTSLVVNRMETARRTIAGVRVAGVDAALARTLERRSRRAPVRSSPTRRSPRISGACGRSA